MPALVMLFALLLVACGSAEPPVCPLGRVEACACPGGSQGAQECGPLGVWSACVCLGGDAGNAVAVADATPDAVVDVAVDDAARDAPAVDASGDVPGDVVDAAPACPAAIPAFVASTTPPEAILRSSTSVTARSDRGAEGSSGGCGVNVDAVNISVRACTPGSSRCVSISVARVAGAYVANLGDESTGATRSSPQVMVYRGARYLEIGTTARQRENVSVVARFPGACVETFELMGAGCPVTGI